MAALFIGVTMAFPDGAGRRLGRQDRALVEIAAERLCATTPKQSPPQPAYGDSEACDPLPNRDHRLA